MLQKSTILLCLLAAGMSARADILTATFTNVVVAGNIANDPAVGDLTYMDNTSTAYAPTSGLPFGVLSWGSNAGSGLPPGETFSQVIFEGTPVIPGSSNPQKIGTISFLNGTSALNTLIFGATINFYDGASLLGSDNLIITTTSNQTSGLNTQQLQEDADYINICGNSSNICGSSLEAYEDSETGTLTPVVADLYADLDFSLTGLTVDTSIAGNANLGTVGNLAPLSQVPEPSSVVLSLTILAISLYLLRRRRSVRSLV